MQDKNIGLVDLDTGTVLSVAEEGKSFTLVENGDRIVRRKSIAFLGKTHKVVFPFSKVNTNAIEKYGLEMPLLCFFISRARYMDNYIVHKNGQEIYLKDIPKILGKNERTIRRQLQKLFEKDIIHKIKKGNSYLLVLNPFVATKGKVITEELYQEFKETEEEINA